MNPNQSVAGEMTCITSQIPAPTWLEIASRARKHLFPRLQGLHPNWRLVLFLWAEFSHILFIQTEAFDRRYGTKLFHHAHFK